MGEITAIGWTDHTFNGWWGCQRVSPGCEHCYAETFSKRVGLKLWGPVSEHRKFGEKHWGEPRKWNAAAAKEGKRARVFCSSMADVFEDRRDLDAERAKLWPLIEETPWLDWQLLTKRPENMNRLAPASWRGGWPLNVWAGCTVEDQERAEKRVLWLLDVPAKVRFLSCEPLLEPVDLTCINMNRALNLPEDGLGPRIRLDALRGHMAGPDDMLDERIGWVIVGGESGPGARPFHLAWARSIVEQCRAAGVACFVKQMGSKAIGADGSRVIFTGKADDPREWAEELRVQEFPS